MELLIRSQDKIALIKCNNSIRIGTYKPFVTVIDIDLKTSHKEEMYNIYVDNESVGRYSSRKRALEILDEISSKIKNQYLVKCHALMKPSDMQKIKRQLEDEYLEDFLLEDQHFEIKPLNQNVIYYEMPEK